MLPRQLPSGSRSGDTVTPTGTFFPQRDTRSPSPLALSCVGGKLFLINSTSQVSLRKIRRNDKLIARDAARSVSISAASLKKETLPLRSRVITPSSTLERICSHEICRSRGADSGLIVFMTWIGGRGKHSK